MSPTVKSSPFRPVMVVTGTSRGLGEAIARYFLAKGYEVVGCSRGDASIAGVGGYHHYRVDVSDEQSVRMFARTVKAELGRVDVVVCNVGVVKLGAVTGATSLKVFSEFVHGILTSTFLVCREFSKMMLLQRSGRIVNISSIMSELHAPGTAAYASAKKAVVEFTKVLAREVVDYGITCNVVSPSLVRTSSSEAFGKSWEASMLSMQTIQRALEPQEVCSLIEFFAAPSSSCVTGQVLHTCLVD